MEQQVFLCPLCNAPHDEKLQPGTLQVTCKYCGGVILVPSRLSGLYERCPDHPGSQSVGFCTECGRNCCDVCLHVFERFGVPTTRYLCPKCTKAALSRESVGRYLSLACSLTVMISMAILLLLAFRTPGPTTGYGYVFGYLLVAAMLLVCTMFERSANSGTVPTLREKKQKPMDPAGYAWKQCPHCNAGYFYALSEIESARAVTCQNCGRPYELAE